MFADIANGNLDAADAFFLISAILAVLAAVIYLARPPYSHIASAILALSVGGVALALMLL